MYNTFYIYCILVASNTFISGINHKKVQIVSHTVKTTRSGLWSVFCCTCICRDYRDGSVISPGYSQDGSSRNLARPFDHPCKYSNFTLALDPISLPPTRHSWTLLLLPLGSFNNENMKFRNSFCSLPKAVSSSSSSSSSPPVLNKHPGGSGF